MIENEDLFAQGAAGTKWSADYLLTKMLPGQHVRAWGAPSRNAYGWTHLLESEKG